MNGKNIFFVASIIISFSMYGMEEHVDEWIGIQRYWNPTRYHSIIYRHCVKTTNDQNCAIINAYFLLLAEEKQYAEEKVQLFEERIRTIEQEIVKNSDADFIEKRRLQLDKANDIHWKKQSENQLQRVMKQVKMGNLSEKLQDNGTQKKLEHAFNAIVTEGNISFELDCLEETQKYAQQRIVPYKGGSTVGLGWRYYATMGPKNDDE